MGFLDSLFGPPTSKKFGALFIEELRRAGVTDPLTYDPEGDRVIFGRAEDSHSINLGAFYREYVALPKSARAKHLAERARLFAVKDRPLPDDIDEARGHLCPKLWPRAALEKTRLQVQIDGGDPTQLDIPDYEIGSHLTASIVYDLPDMVMSVNREQLDKWGLSYYEALEIARTNLEQSPCKVAEIGTGCYALTTGDSYDASRLLLPRLIQQFKVDGDCIAMAPSRDLLLVCGSEDSAGLKIMADLGLEATREHPRLLVPIPLRLEGDHWIEWRPAPIHVLAGAFRELELQFLHQEYGDQQSLLNRLYEKTQTDVFVATYSVRKNDDGRYLVCAAWTKSVPTLLPRTDVIFFVSDKDVVARATWETVEKVVGRLMQPTDLYPERVKVEQFPSDEQLQALGMAEL